MPFVDKMSPIAVDLLHRFERIRTNAHNYFKAVEQQLPESAWEFNAAKLWAKLPLEIMETAQHITADLIILASDLGIAVRSSPILSEADEQDVGLSLKGMRSALRLAEFRYSEPDILHDEGTVLGYKPASQSSWRAILPNEVLETFDEWADKFQAVCELVGMGAGERPIVLTGNGLTVSAGIRPRTAFIMMAMQKDRPELEDIVKTVKRCFTKFGITALRADDIEHDDIVTKRILDEIRTAELLFADLTLERPSVYYEVGYAHALGRRVMLYRRSHTPIHFDLAAYNCPEYENLSKLEELLTRRLESVTGEHPSNQSA